MLSVFRKVWKLEKFRERGAESEWVEGDPTEKAERP